MKTINSKKRKFCGTIKIGTDEIFVNTSDGTGFYKVLQLLEPMVHTLIKLGLSYCPWSTYDDIKQDIYLSLIEGIPKYNPDRGASISTFLYKFIKNKIIDKSRSRDTIRGRYRYLVVYDDVCGLHYEMPDVVDKIDIMRIIDDLDTRWRRIMFRLFVADDSIASVACDECMTPWGLTRAVRKKLNSIKKT